MTRNLRFVLALPVALLLFSVLPVSATSITTSSYATWKSSTYITGSPTELNFTTIANANYPSGDILYPTGNSSLAFTFTGSGLKGNSGNGSLSASSITLTMPGVGENAFLFGLLGSTPFTLTLSDNESFTVTNPGSTPLFGIALSTEITSLTITTTSGSQVGVNDFFFATSALPQDTGNPSVPSTASEGATVVLTSGGLLIFFGARRKWTARFGATPTLA